MKGMDSYHRHETGVRMERIMHAIEGTTAESDVIAPRNAARSQVHEGCPGPARFQVRPVIYKDVEETGIQKLGKL